MEVKSDSSLSEQDVIEDLIFLLQDMQGICDREIKDGYEYDFETTLKKIDKDPAVAAEKLMSVIEQMEWHDAEKKEDKGYETLIKKICIGVYMAFFLFYQYSAWSGYFQYGYMQEYYGWCTVLLLIIIPLIVRYAWRFGSSLDVLNDISDETWHSTLYERLKKYRN